jgi:hypothetical protein
MSYFKRTAANEWNYDKAFNEYLKTYGNEQVATDKMKADLESFQSDYNYSKRLKTKARCLLESMKKKPHSPISIANDGINNQVYYMDGQNTINNFMNSNGKRTSESLQDPFQKLGGENSNLFNKLLETFNEEAEEQAEEEEEEEEEQAEEEEAILQEDIQYNNSAFGNNLNIIDSIKDWKSTATYEKVIHKQDLLFYNIIDITKDTTIDTLKDYLPQIKEIDIPTFVDPVEDDNNAQNVDVKQCNSFSALSSYYNNNKTKLSYPIKKTIKT